jgi:hypothetical protein
LKQVASRRSQRGYLFEIPLVLLVLLLALALILPRVPVIVQKLLLAVATVPTLFCFYYLIVAPGWTATAVPRTRAVWRLALFLTCAAAVIGAVAAFIVR